MPAVREEELRSTTDTPRTVPSRLYSTSFTPSLKEFNKLCSQSVDRELYPSASEFASNIPIYDLRNVSTADSSTTSTLQDEWHHILLSGPGVVILRSFFTDTALIDRVNDAFSSIIAHESSAAQTQKGDHFAASGLNSRIWNSFQKHALSDPSSFTSYYSNPWLQLISESWLGPAYQITAQVNIVHPGGKPQVPHRDYHLGFQTVDSCSRFPRPIQISSSLLTLQGAVAHTDMPLPSGPTRFLPFSQQFQPGFMAYRLPDFIAYFDDHWVSAPLHKGDAVFFNPALVHAAGQNDTTDIMRSANLLQISSAFGRAMEHVDTIKIVGAVWDELTAAFKTQGWSQQVEALVNAVAEGYPFPTNLDKRPPAPGGMAPKSELDLVREGLEGRVGREEMLERLRRVRDDGLG